MDTRLVCLLRGINVGGNNIIKMNDLKDSFLEMGFTNPVSYIQSGNIVFSSKKGTIPEITEKIEKVLSKTFGYKAAVVVLSQKDFSAVVKKAPKHFGDDPEKFRYDVLFFMSSESPKKHFNTIEIKKGVDESFLGTCVVYYKRLISKATQSKLNKLVASPVYKIVTIRNWNTTKKIYDLFD